MVIEFRRPNKPATDQRVVIVPTEFVALMHDETGFIALVGRNSREGIAGFGNTPPKALRDLADRMEFESYRLSMLDG